MDKCFGTQGNGGWCMQYIHFVASQTSFLSAPVGQASKQRRQSAHSWAIGDRAPQKSADFSGTPLAMTRLVFGTGALMRISPGWTRLPSVGWMSWWFLPINPSPASTHQRRSSIGAESQKICWCVCDTISSPNSCFSIASSL